MSVNRPQKNSRRRRKKWRGKSVSERGIITGVAVLAFIGIILVAYRYFDTSRRKLFHTFEDGGFSDKYTVRGVDVSHHNSFINWDRLRDENITFAYMKSTEGVSHKDRDYKRNYRLAKNSGIKVGTYHFYIFGLDGQKQAQHFIRNSTIKSGDLIPAIDVEHSNVNAVCRSKKDRNNMLSELKKLEQALFNRYGKHPVIYTNKDCYRAYIESEFPDNPIWICDLHDEPNVASNHWVIWQFSHTGNINGVINDIDLNYYRDSFNKFKTLLLP